MQNYLNIISQDECIGCGACSAICPQSCITTTNDCYGFTIPMVDLEQCIHCGLCKKSCPVLNYNYSINPQKPLHVYATKNKNENIVNKSSSGGAFSAFAEYVLSKQGVVYGVTLASNLTAEHVRISQFDDINKIRGSKYIQSHAYKAFPLVKRDLDSEKLVLFSGTPCQIAAIRQFLRKEYSNLLCIEVVCHGVPSDLAFQEYTKQLVKKYRSPIATINFRDKSKGWQTNCISFKFENGKHFQQKSSENLYIQGYINNLFVRESCTNCLFKAQKSNADITLGDMWGIERIYPSYDLTGGVSMICTNTSIGKMLLSSVMDKITDCTEVSYENVKQHNECIYRSVKCHKNRKYVLDHLSKKPYNSLIKEALGITYQTIIIKKFISIKTQIIGILVFLKHLVAK